MIFFSAFQYLSSVDEGTRLSAQRSTSAISSYLVSLLSSSSLSGNNDVTMILVCIHRPFRRPKRRIISTIYEPKYVSTITVVEQTPAHGV